MGSVGCGSFAIWLCEFLEGAWNGGDGGGGGRRRGRLAFVSCCEASHSVDRCYRWSSVLCSIHKDPLNFVQTLIDPVIVLLASLD